MCYPQSKLNKLKKITLSSIVIEGIETFIFFKKIF